MPEFTVDWTSHNTEVWEKLFGAVRDAPIKILEIGSWEGRSAVWFLEYLHKSTITCIDTFAGGDEHFAMVALPLVEKRFDANLAPYASRCEKIKHTSHRALAILGINHRRFNVIYVDGSHSPVDVYMDAMLAWPLLAKTGFMIFDDYEWRGDGDGSYCPKTGIDAFLAGTVHQKIFVGYQLIVGKP